MLSQMAESQVERKIITHTPAGKDAQDSFLDRYNAFHVQQRNFTISEFSSKALYFHLIELRLDVASRNRIIKRP
jgi:hypothetical protein